MIKGGFPFNRCNTSELLMVIEFIALPLSFMWTFIGALSVRFHCHQ